MKYFIFNKSIYRVAALLGSMSWTRHKWSLSSNSPAAAAAKSLSCVWLCAISLTIAHQAPLSMGFSRPKYCSGLPFPSPGDLPDPGNEPVTLMYPALAGRFFTIVPTGKLPVNKSISGASAFLSVKWRYARLSLMIRMQLFWKPVMTPKCLQNLLFPRIPPRKAVDLGCLRSRR